MPMIQKASKSATGSQTGRSHQMFHGTAWGTAKGCHFQGFPLLLSYSILRIYIREEEKIARRLHPRHWSHTKNLPHGTIRPAATTPPGGCSSALHRIRLDFYRVGRDVRDAPVAARCAQKLAHQPGRGHNRFSDTRKTTPIREANSTTPSIRSSVCPELPWPGGNIGAGMLPHATTYLARRGAVTWGRVLGRALL